MSNMTRTGTARLADPHAPVRFTAVAGEALAIGDACFIHSDGLAYQCDATDHVSIANVSAFEGICLSTCVAGQPVTLFGIGSKIWISDTSQTIASFWFVGNTQGTLSSAKVATSDTDKPVGKMITANVMEVVHSGGIS